MIARALVLAALAGCSSILGIEDLEGPSIGPNDSGPRDTGADVMVGERVSLMGTASVIELQGTGMTLAGVQLDFMQPQLAQSTQTTQSGSYVFSLPTNGQPIDGFIVLHQSPTGGYPHTHVVPPVLTGDRNFGLVTGSQNAIQMLASFAGEPHDPASTFVVFQVTGLGGSPLAGVNLACEVDTSIVYADDSGFPRQGAVQTGSLGLAYMFNAPPSLGLCFANGPSGTAQRRIETVSPNAPIAPGVLAVSLEVTGD